MHRTVSIQVPVNAAPGDSLVFQVDGCDLEVSLPLDAKPGDLLSIQIGDERQNSLSNSIDQDEDEDESVTMVPLDSGETLEIRSSNEITKECDTDGTCSVLWSAGIHLARFLSSPMAAVLLEHMYTAVELGSGLGIGGLSLCSALSRMHRKDGATKSHVVFTDVLSALPLLRHNIQANQQIWAPVPASIEIETHVQVLEWGQQNINLPFDEPVNLVIASDLLYNSTEALYIKLADSICSLLLPEKRSVQVRRFIICVRWRKPEVERHFFELLGQRGIHLHLLTGFGNGSSDLDWKDFGNPECDRSNRYFLDTFIRVHGSLVSLAEVEESHMQVMSDDEYALFESKFIQIYYSK